jgi:hypothetical protein
MQNGRTSLKNKKEAFSSQPSALSIQHSAKANRLMPETHSRGRLCHKSMGSEAARFRSFDSRLRRSLTMTG